MNKIRKPNVKNTSPAYWEKVLESHGLGVEQPLTDNSTEPGVPQTSKMKGKISQASAKATRSDEDLLRQIVDGNESFLERASTMKIREIDRDIPDWALNDSRVREILLCSFPKLNTDDSQRVKAARWFRIIYLYYRMRLPRQIVAKELRLSEESLNYFIQSISWASAGLYRGKPRKKRKHIPPTPTEGIGRKGNGETI